MVPFTISLEENVIFPLPVQLVDGAVNVYDFNEPVSAAPVGFSVEP